MSSSQFLLSQNVTNLQLNKEHDLYLLSAHYPANGLLMGLQDLSTITAFDEKVNSMCSAKIIQLSTKIKYIHRILIFMSLMLF